MTANSKPNPMQKAFRSPNFRLLWGGQLTSILGDQFSMIAQASRREIIVVDESKLSPALGTHWAVPVEVIPFGWGSQAAYLRSLKADLQVRKNQDGTLFNTDQGNWILDCNFGPITDPVSLACQLSGRAGIVEHGLFIGLASDVIVAGENGCRYLSRKLA